MNAAPGDAENPAGVLFWLTAGGSVSAGSRNKLVAVLMVPVLPVAVPVLPVAVLRVAVLRVGLAAPVLYRACGGRAC
jgi:hypothetical protein